MKKFLYSLISIWFCLGSTVLSQNPKWINYNTANSDIPSDSINCIAIDGLGNKWIGTRSEGLAKFDGTNWTVYNTSNSDLPDNTIECLAIDGSGNKWIGTLGGGLAKFDGTYWTVYNDTNSGLPGNWVISIAIDGSGNKWIGTDRPYINGQGLAKYDDTTWFVYNTSNSGLPDNYVGCIATDDFNNKWIGAGGNFVKFYDTTWTVYDTPSPWGFGLGPIECITIDNTGNKWVGVTRGEPLGWSGLIKYDDETFTYYDESDSVFHGIHCIAIDEFDNKWIGSIGGLANFNDTNWTVYNTSNSGLPDNWVLSLAIDGSGNKWIGTREGGLAVYNEGGIVSVEENPTSRGIIPNEYLLSQNYPNPFNPSTRIKYSIPKLSFITIKIYDLLGSEVAAFVNEEKSVGTYEVEFNSTVGSLQLASGIYFYRLQVIDPESSSGQGFVETKKMILLK